MAVRRCLGTPDRRCALRTPHTRCPACASAMKRIRNAEAVRARAVVEQWVAVHGWVCPGYRRPPHPSHDLTADHVVPVIRGGAGGELRTLCRGCNAARGNA